MWRKKRAWFRIFGFAVIETATKEGSLPKKATVCELGDACRVPDLSIVIYQRWEGSRSECFASGADRDAV